MTRQKRSVVVVAVATVAASLSAFGVYRAITHIPVRNVEIATHHAVVAARAMPMGTQLTADSLKLVEWPAKTPLTGGFDGLDAVVGRGLIAPIVENEPLIESKLAPRAAGAGLSPAIPAGMRAMSIKVNEVIGVAGFVVPGTRVDVMVTIRQKEDSVTRVVVHNAQVLTAGTRYDQENMKDGKPIPSTVVTLMVNPDDAERIALAQSEGQMMLALRNPLDMESTQTSGIRTAGLLGGGVPLSPAHVRPAAVPASATHAVIETPKPAVYMVEAFRGSKRTEEIVR
jgi:pilus assembly protein CpaB